MKSFFNRPTVTLFLGWLLFGGLYVLSAQLGVDLSLLLGATSPISPSAAIALAAGMIIGYRAAVAVWLGTMIANSDSLQGPSALTAAVALATGATGQMIVATALLRRFVPNLCIRRGEVPAQRSSTSTARDFLRFIAITAVASVIAPLFGVLSLNLAAYVSPADIIGIGILSWLSIYAGILTLTPLLVVMALAWHKRALEPIVFPITTVWLGLSLIVSYIVWQNRTIAAAAPLRHGSPKPGRPIPTGI